MYAKRLNNLCQRFTHSIHRKLGSRIDRASPKVKEACRREINNVSRSLLPLLRQSPTDHIKGAEDIRLEIPAFIFTIAKLGKLDILVNNAGIAIQDQMVDDLNLDEQKYNQQWQVNVMGSIAVTRAAAPKLKDGRRIIIVGSLLGDYIPFKGH